MAKSDPEAPAGAAPHPQKQEDEMPNEDLDPRGDRECLPEDPRTASQIEVVREPYRERPIAQLHAVLSMLCHYIWHKELRPGEHMWSIPVDKERDFDCILSDAIDELEARRATARLPPAPATQRPEEK